MSIVKLNTIKQWFKTGLKPTQVQFWNTWDSFWHKEDQIPASNIENLEMLLADKADNEALLQHFKDNDAHGLKKVRDELKKKGVTLDIKDNIIQLKDKEGNPISEIEIPKVKNNQTVSFKSGKDNPNGSEEAQKFVEASDSNQLLFWEGKSTGAEKEIVSTVYYYHRITKIWYVLSPWDSYWHKLDKIPVKSILGLTEILKNKADSTDLQNHISDNDAHGLKEVREELIKKGTKLTIKDNKLSLWSANDTKLSEVELQNSIPNDFYSEGTFIPYLTDLGGGATYSGSFSGSYVKTGNMLTLHINMRRIVTKGTPTGSLLIEGMPFKIKLPTGFSITRFYNASTLQNPIQNKDSERSPFKIKLPTGFSISKKNNPSSLVIPREKIYSVRIGTDSGGRSLGVKLKNDTNVSIPQYSPPIKFTNGYISFSGSCIID